MPDALAQAKQRLAPIFDTHEPLNLDPIVADPWVISSLLQKSIRRGEAEIAQRAAHTLFTLKGSAIWRRYMVIAFEDIGAGSTDALSLTVAAGTDPAWRKQCGGDAHVAITLARILAEAPKDRSADYLICSAKDHPSLSGERLAIASTGIEERLSVVRDRAFTLPHREMAAWYASGVEWGGEKQVGKGDLPALLNAFTELGVPTELVAATGIAISRTREPITLMVPLVWLAANDGQTVSVCDRPVPPLATAGGVPLYALDDVAHFQK